MQVSGSDSGLIGADALIQAEQVVGDARSNRRPLPRDDCALILEIGEHRGHGIGLCCTLRREAVALGMQLPDRCERTLDPLHDLELDILELGLTTCQGLELMLEVRELLGIVHGA